jgi:hypothetical protein
VLRLLFLLALAITLTVCGATVKLGKRTFFGHVQAIWKTEEAQDAKEGIKGKARPTFDKLERAGKKAYDELKKDQDAGPARRERR